MFGPVLNPALKKALASQAPQPGTPRPAAPEVPAIPPGYEPQPSGPGSLPNWDKLTEQERWVTQRLAGIPQPIAKALDWFNGTAFGKALMLLDVPAEVGERTYGLIEQISTASREGRLDQFLKELGPAWYAGSLAADMNNISVGTQPGGPVYHTEDLPSAGGLEQARARIIELTGQVTGGQVIGLDDALKQTRAEFYQESGALAIRSQLQDAGWHIILDPLWVLPHFGLSKAAAWGEKLTFKTAGVLGAKLVEEAAAAEKTLSAARAALKVAEAAGDAEKVAQATANLADARKILEVAQGAEKIAEAQKGVSVAEEALAAIEKGKAVAATALTAAEKTVHETRAAVEFSKIMSPFEEKMYRIFFDPLKEPAKGLWGFFSPNAPSRAHEWRAVFGDTLDAKLFSQLWVDGKFDAAEAVRVLKAASDGTYDPKLLGLMTTEVGRQVLAEMRGASEAAIRVAVAEGTARATGSIDLLRFVGAALKTNPEKLLVEFQKDGIAKIYARFQEALKLPEVAQAFEKVKAGNGLLRQSQLTLDNLAMHFELFKDGKELRHLWSPAWVATKMRLTIEEQAVQKWIVKFGVKERGFAQAMNHAIKSAESLVLLRMNPVYPVRNFFNNVFTMLARGAYGFASDGAAEKYLRKLSLIPPRALEGFGMEGEAIRLTDTVGQAIADAQKSRKYAFFENLADDIQNVKLPGAGGIFDAPGIEARASQIAMATGVKRFLKDNWGPGRGFLVTLQEGMPAAYRELGARADMLSSKIASALTPADLDALKTDSNLLLSTDWLRKRVEAKLGFTLEDSLGTLGADELLESGVQAIKDGKLAEWPSLAHTIAEEHLQVRYEATVADLVEQAAAQSQIGGYRAATRLMQRAVNEMWSAKIAQDVSTAADAARIRKLEQAEKGVAWTEKFLTTDAFFDRLFGRIDATFSGIEKGMKAGGWADLTLLRDGWKEFRGVWGDFFSLRRKTIESWKTGQITFDDYSRIMNDAYVAATAKEDAAFARMDNALIQMYPAEERAAFAAARSQAAEFRRADKQLYLRFRQEIQGMDDERDIMAAYAKENARRIFREKQLYGLEAASYAAPTDPTARAALGADMAKYEQAAREQERVRRLLAAGPLSPEDQKILDEYVAARATRAEAKQLDALTAEIETRPGALEELNALKAEIANRAAGVPPRRPIPDYERFAPSLNPEEAVADMEWNVRGRRILQMFEQEGADLLREKPLRYPDLSPEAQAQFDGYIDLAKMRLADAKYGAVRFGEVIRDSALLNYSRRSDFDNFLGLLMPYHFWATHSMFNWALWSLDRPGMLTNYLRIQKFLDTAYRPEPGLPSRLRGKIRIKLPFLPEWMGDQFIDPFNLALPFNQWAQIYDQPAGQARRDADNAERLLGQMLNDGQITEAEYQQTLQLRAGPIWDRAVSMGQQDDAEGRANAMDFLSLFSSPHLPITWAWNAATGHPEKNTPTVPLTRTLGAFLTAFGVDPTSMANPEAYIRKQVGLPAFDRFDDYRTERAIANLVGEGKVPAADGVRAMIDKSGIIWEQGRRRSYEEKTAGILGAVGVLFGLPAYSYPEGEENLRHLDARVKELYAAYDAAEGEAAKEEVAAQINAFYDANPAYAARRALFAKPEERMQMFLVDQLWDKYLSLPRLNRKEAREALGPLFEQAFLNTDTRSYNALSAEQLGAWLVMLGGDPPGSLRVKDAIPIQFAPPEIADRAEYFYNYRDQNFPAWREQSDVYYSLDPAGETPLKQPAWMQAFVNERKTKFPGIDAVMAQYDAILGAKPRSRFKKGHPEIGAYLDWRAWYSRNNDDFSAWVGKDDVIKDAGIDSRKAYLQAHPDFAAYQKWWRGWLLQNPDAAPYLTDNPPKYENEAAALVQDRFSPQEWIAAIGEPTYRLLDDYRYGETLPAVVKTRLEALADELGWGGSIEDLAEYISEAD